MGPSSSTDERSPVAKKLRAYVVHLYTASGIVFAFLATAEICRSDPGPRWVFLWLAVAGVIDATDGPLARRWQVKARAPRIQGRTMDDIVDYLTFTFIPLLLVWRMGWVPAPALLWIAPALVASLFGFGNVAAKQEAEGFFVGFPSYWNVVAYYAGLWVANVGFPEAVAVVIVLLALLTVLPVRFLYPNRAPAPWRIPIIVGGSAWFVLLVGLLPWYPAVPLWLAGVSLIYPAFYFGLSFYLDVRM